jgi:hypothetical protein
MADEKRDGMREERKRSPSPMEFGSMPLDPVYGWSRVYEPVETLIEETTAYIEQLARQVHQRGEPYTDEELEEKFLAFWERLVAEGTLRRLPDRPPEFGRAILGPRRWLNAQQIRIERLVTHWEQEGK